MGGAVALLLPNDILMNAKSFVNIEGNLIDADCGIVSRKIVSVTPAEFESDILPKMQIELNNLGEKYAENEAPPVIAFYKSAESLVAWSDNNKLLEVFLELPYRKAYFFGDENAEHPTVTAVGDIPKVKIRQSGHFPMIDNPKEFYGELFRFISGANRI